MTLSGRVAVITGASSGIGLACAEQLAGQGVAVMLGARRADRLQAVVDRIQAKGGRAGWVAMDVTFELEVNELVRRACELFGGLDIMICNAGFGFYGTVEETPPDVMRRMMEVNFTGTFLSARAALPIFREQQRGHLIIVSSIVGRRGIPLMSGYTATKAAQAGFAECLRSEFAGTNIHVSCVYPISTETEFRDAIARDYGHQVEGLGPRQSVDHVAGAIVDCLLHPRPEVYQLRKSRGLPILNALVPGLTDRIVRRFGRRRDIRQIPPTPSSR
jgi:NAD(P)-dependent dehydrogenase (short-subunit alcohol dehydrogenase family)